MMPEANCLRLSEAEICLSELSLSENSFVCYLYLYLMRQKSTQSIVETINILEEKILKVNLIVADNEPNYACHRYTYIYDYYLLFLLHYCSCITVHDIF